ncbi:MAG: Fic family protein [Acidobacteria bacterium]|nr:Fic family protein [Acidobacteriota bacterium]
MRRKGKYIHELADWPRFRWDQVRLALPLAEVRHRQGRLIGRMEALGFALRQEASLEALTSDAVETSKIEGETLDAEQVRSSLARRLGVDIGALAPVDRDVEGIVEVTLDAAANFRAPLTDERLFGWHAALFPTGRSGITKVRVGAWRDDAYGPMQVVSGPIGRETVHYEAPKAERLGPEMAAFTRWFNGADEADPVLKAALAHLWFVTLHPFDDGNGRIARAIADMQLARSEGTAQRFYSLSAQIRRERAAYYAILERTQKGDLDVTDWVEWFLACLDRAIEAAYVELETVLGKAKFWERVRSVALNERQRGVLNRLLDGFEGKLTTSKWAKLAKCSHDTALRDIQDLLRRGILAQNEAGGRSTSYRLVQDQG